MVRTIGVAPLLAKVYELERLRCGLCGTVFTAEPPPVVGQAKYDESAAAMIGLLKYGCGLPFHRIERLQRGFGPPAAGRHAMDRRVRRCTKPDADLRRTGAPSRARNRALQR